MDAETNSSVTAEDSYYKTMHFSAYFKQGDMPTMYKLNCKTVNHFKVSKKLPGTKSLRYFAILLSIIFDIPMHHLYLT